MSIAGPPAPSLETVFDVEGNVDPAIYAALYQAGIIEADGPRGERDTHTPRVEFQLILGKVRVRNKLPAGVTDPRQALPTSWDCTAVFSVVTDRVKNPRAHSPYRARVRGFIAQFWSQLNTRLPYHTFAEMAEAGTVPGLFNQDAREEDISKIHCTGVVAIRDTAWGNLV